MHDEACPHYEDFLNNMMLGHQFALREFGVAPRIGWQIDPFGHSNTNARFFAEMGFDAFFFARIDYQDRERRLEKKEMEFVWRPSFDELGESSQILASTLNPHYSAPKDINFDLFKSGYGKINMFNAWSHIKSMYNRIQYQSEHYRSNQLLVTMGEDFAF